MSEYFRKYQIPFQFSTICNAVLFVSMFQMPFAHGQQKDCDSAANEANGACNTPSLTAGMSGGQAGQMAGLQQQLGQANQGVGGIGSSQASQCKNQATMSKILAAISALKAAACASAISECTKTCDQEAKQYEMMKQKQKADEKKQKKQQCEGMQGQAAAAAAQGAAMLAGAMTNDQCDAMASTNGGQPTPTCENDPAYAAKTTECICKKDPKNLICGGVDPSPSGISTTGSGRAPAGTISSGAIIPVGESPGAGSASRLGDGKTDSTGIGLGESALRGDNPVKAVSAAENDLKNKTSLGIDSYGSGGGSGGNYGGGRNASDYEALKKLANAKRLSGMSVLQKDGVTGPMGLSIFEKVTRQYQVQKANMIQDR